MGNVVVNASIIGAFVNEFGNVRNHYGVVSEDIFGGEIL